MEIAENRNKQNALDLAEQARQAEWRHPSFVAELFQGNFRWDLIHPYPHQTDHDKRIGDEFIEKVRVVLEKYVDPDEVDRTGEVPREALLALADLGCFGLKIPVQYGGSGMSQTNYNRICAFIGSYCASTAVFISAHQSIGVPQPLNLFGTQEQKDKYLPRLARGAISAFALTEPGVGSDPARMTTTATPSEDGSYYLINGEKLWCTNGPVAEILVVMAVTPPKVIKGKERKQITAFIVEADMPGFEVAHLCSFMGIRGISNGLLRFTNLKAPKENIIGKEGDGLKIALTTLNAGRLTVPATSAALGKAAMQISRDWCRERVQWGAPIGEHQAVAGKLAMIAADTFAMDSIAWLASAMMDRGDVDIRLEAAMAKYYCTETSCRIADDLVQIRGGRGYETSLSLASRGEPPIPVERIYRDCRIARIIEGTSEIMRLFIAREAMDAHVRRITPLTDSRRRWSEKRPLIWQALKFYLPWYCKQWLPAGRDYSAVHLSSVNGGHLEFIGRASRRLARTVFHTMAKYQQKLQREQLILQRLVDIGTDLFAMAAVLSNAETRIAQNGPDPELQNVVDLFCVTARQRIRQNFRSVKYHHHRLLDTVAQTFRDGKYQWMITDLYQKPPPASGQPSTTDEPVGSPEPEPANTETTPSEETKAGV